MNIHGQTAADIFESIRLLVHSQQILAGQALPPVRELARQLGVNRNTVATVYRRLVTAGIATAQGRLGTIIRATPGPGEQEGMRAESPLRDLADGNPNPAWLPDLSATWHSRHYQPRLYGTATLNPGLERYLQLWCAPDCPRGFSLDLTHGAVDAIERLLATCLRPGDKVAVENPCFLSSINLLRNAGLQSLGVAVDQEGMSAEGLQQVLVRGVQAVILTPRAHNPTGCSLSSRRAQALMRVLEQHPHVLVIVDDHFSLLSGQPYYNVIPRKARRWALVRSFSKALGPDLRVAAVASDPATSHQLRARLSPGSQWVSHFLQDAIEFTLSRAGTAQLIQRASSDYLRRRSDLEHALRQCGITAWEGGDGLNLWLPLEGDEHAAAKAMEEKGWLLRRGAIFSVDGKMAGLRITLSTLDTDMAQALARDLQQSLN